MVVEKLSIKSHVCRYPTLLSRSREVTSYLSLLSFFDERYLSEKFFRCDYSIKRDVTRVTCIMIILYLEILLSWVMLSRIVLSSNCFINI